MPLLSYSSDDAAPPPDTPDVTPQSKSGGLLAYSSDALPGATSPETTGSAYVTAGGKSTWGDVGKAAMAGVHEAGSTIASDFASHAYTPEAVQRWQGMAEESVPQQRRTYKA